VAQGAPDQESREATNEQAEKPNATPCTADATPRRWRSQEQRSHDEHGPTSAHGQWAKTLKIADYQATYRDLSGTASELARTLALSGIAVIWVFAVTTHDDQQKLPDALLLPGILIIASLALDLLQYVLGAAVYGICARVLEYKKVSPEREMNHPSWFNWPAIACYWGKLGAIGIAYYYLLDYMFCNLFARQG
jgi:hypothetical protein